MEGLKRSIPVIIQEQNAFPGITTRWFSKRANEVFIAFKEAQDFIENKCTLSGNPIGGNTMVKFGTEFRVPFAENPVVYGLIFAEMGNVWSSIDLMERLSLPRSGPIDLKRSVGTGIRFFMPMIGMLGFDIGYGFDRVNQNGELEPAWKTTLTFGQQF